MSHNSNETPSQAPGEAFRIRCPYCGALQFMSPHRWVEADIDTCHLAIKCWRRTCKQLLFLRLRK